MTTATKPAKEMTELEKLKAELAAAKAEAESLKAKLESVKTSGRGAVPFPVESLAAEGTSLRYLQGKMRTDVYDAAGKMIRALGVVEAYNLIHGVAESLAKVQGKTAVEVIDAAMVRAVRGPRAEKAPKVTEEA